MPRHSNSSKSVAKKRTTASRAKPARPKNIKLASAASVKSVQKAVVELSDALLNPDEGILALTTEFRDGIDTVNMQLDEITKTLLTLSNHIKRLTEEHERVAENTANIRAKLNQSEKPQPNSGTMQSALGPLSDRGGHGLALGGFNTAKK